MGSIEEIISDKTGVLSENKMQVKTIYVEGETKSSLVGTSLST